MKTEGKTILATRAGDSVPSTTSCSHLIFKAYKFRIYPNAEQRTLLSKHFGCCRFIYNKFLERRKSVYEQTKKSLDYCGTAKELVVLKNSAGTEWLSEVYSHALQAGRKDYTHKITTRIVRENQTVCVEDLNVKGMQSNHHLARSIGSVAFGEIVMQLEYKCAWYGREFVKVGRFYPSSKTCNHCGHVNHELTLKDREWVCEECGAEIDRDYNAALNILAEGKRILSGDGALSDIKQKGGEAAA